MSYNLYDHDSMTCEILFLGNELLIGKTVNTNLTWLGKELTHRGVTVYRAVTVQDVKASIVPEIQDILSRKPSLFIINGGLGPTFDDIQLECVAEALNEPLVLHEQALKEVKAFYDRLSLPLTKEREKMAWLPKNAMMLSNRVGAAPGALIQYNNTMIVCLPGVPSEMKQLMLDHVLPKIEELNKNKGLEMTDYMFQVKGLPESSLAPILKEFVEIHPRLGFKSHPMGHEGKPELEIHVYGIVSTPKLVLEVSQKLHHRIQHEFPQAHVTPIQAVLKPTGE